jgi:hypothetical protein
MLQLAAMTVALIDEIPAPRRVTRRRARVLATATLTAEQVNVQHRIGRFAATVLGLLPETTADGGGSR